MQVQRCPYFCVVMVKKRSDSLTNQSTDQSAVRALCLRGGVGPLRSDKERGSLIGAKAYWDTAPREEWAPAVLRP